ncbi:MAG: hypothetical protein GC155_11715 [Alphaproteobacteria bacterium]|nr:hypothetical protein [Alphaproteobacteria bacterium]
MVEKKVTVAVLFAMAMEAAGALVWAGEASQRLSEVEGRVAAQSGLDERMARMEVRLELASAQLSRIEKKLDGAR